MNLEVAFVLWLVGAAIILVGLRVTKKYSNESDGVGFLGSIGFMVLWPVFITLALLFWGLLSATDDKDEKLP